MTGILRFTRAGLVLATLVATPAAAAAQRHFPPDEDLQLMLRYLVEDGETPGIVLGILDADGTKRILHYGSAGPDARPLGHRSVFELGSITKAFTGILLADMAERGEVALDDPVERYLPEGVRMPSRNGREITLLDLATHRSSLPRMPDNMERRGDEVYPAYSMEDLHAFLSSHELRRDIGSEYEYSNIAVALLGDALARAAGRSYEALLRERILDPLGMDMTSTVVAGDLLRWNTQGHRENGGGVAPYRNWPDLPGMGALRSSVEDMLTFLDANLGEPGSRLERVLRAAQEERAPVNDNASMGLNWRVQRFGDRRIITHGGSTAGYETRVAFDPDLGIGFVLLTNVDEFDDDIGLDFLRRGPPLAVSEVTVPVEVLREYVGEYGMASSRGVVRLEPEGWLTVQAPKNVRFRMYAESDSTFVVKRAPWRFRFTRDSTGRVDAMVADFGGSERRAARVSDGGPPPAVVAGNAALDLPLAPDEMNVYVGTYAITVGERTVDLEVFIEDGVLIGRPGPGAPSRLMYQGEHVFIPVANISFLIEFMPEDGLAGSVVLRDDGDVYRGRRKP